MNYRFSAIYKCSSAKTGHVSVLLVFLLIGSFLLISPQPLGAQEGPAFHLLSYESEVHIVLENPPAGTAGFKPYRKGPDDEKFRPLTVQPVTQVSDPHTAYELMGADADWIARKFGTSDPVRLWRKIQVNRGMARAFSLVSPGLRMALGMTLIDRSVTPGEKYSYRLVFIDEREKELDTISRNVVVEADAQVSPPEKVQVKASQGKCNIEWNYRKYRGRSSDLVVGFHVYRKKGAGQAQRINTAPILRIEGYLRYFDSEGEIGNTYQYGVQAVDMGGRVSEVVYADPITLEDTRAPLVPMGLKAIDQEDGVLLLWNLSPDADVTHYNVYRSDALEGEYTQLNQKPVPLDRPEYTDKEMQRGKAWFYKVSAVDAAGNESARCGAATIIPVDTEPPAEISGLEGKVDADARAVMLSWKPSEEKDLAGYMVYRRKSKKGLFRLTHKPLEPDKNPEYEDEGFKAKGLRPGAVYSYEVAAIDISGNEGLRTKIEVSIPDLEPPRKVFSFSARPTRAGAVQLRWQPSLSRDLQLHRIYRVKARQKEPSLIAELKADITRYLDEEVERGVPYEYYIVEVDTAENTSGPSKRERIVPVDITPPGPPESIVVRLQESKLLITWDAPKDPDLNGDVTSEAASDVAGYRVYRAPYPKAKQELLTEELLLERRFFDSQVMEGAVYAITAVDTSGNEGEPAQSRYQSGDGEGRGEEGGPE